MSKINSLQTLFEVLTENSDDLIRLHELDGRSIYASPCPCCGSWARIREPLDDVHPEDLENGRQWWQHI